MANAKPFSKEQWDMIQKMMSGGGSKSSKSSTSSSKTKKQFRPSFGADTGTYYPKSGDNAGVETRYVSGWRKIKAGTLSYFCYPYKKTKEFNGKSGVYKTWMCTITKPSGETFIKPCLYYPQKNQVIVTELNVLIRAGKGGKQGYCGYTSGSKSKK